MKKVYLETYGCQMNVSDSERVATSLAANGFEMTPEQDLADIILINTCSVREKAEQKLYTQVGRIRTFSENKPIIGVMGCVAQLEGETLFDKIQGIDLVLGTKAVGRAADAIVKVLDGEREVVDLGERDPDYDWSVAESQRHSKYIAFVPIIEGCNKFCTYCIVPFSRGREVSLSASEIVRHVLELRRQGVKEIHLIGQNVNSYRPKTDSGLEGFPGATPFSRLLRAVAATGIERIKFNTSFPRDFHSDIIDAINDHENLCNWVHLPVQSGSDRVLKAMKRGHTIDSYKKKIDKLKESNRDIALTTDIIVGFPGETEKDFEDTVDLVEYCGYDSAYIFKYSPRPGTPAFEMTDDVSLEEKTRRFLRLERVQKFNQNVNLKRYINKPVSVLAERVSTRDDNHLTGHSTCQKLVNFKAPKEQIGNLINVKITEIKSNSLFGEVCN
ncbi:MAG TPA: tRNA (N6-isopentenyl adenosine(37)-C2)-methylthiotransferase MiaB [Pyrinomonadaceae bacterium]|jgi:tRNA-2-methylthio-N6-dimethylallyladenosine synthase|nr:tRNA (N6-isopentenyl adenosine(37)-C2)-methylthiotransferase MiaB [Pyrinomonadaceae bacterium]